MPFDEKLATDEYGVFAGDLALAAEPTLGTYRMTATVDSRT